MDGEAKRYFQTQLDEILTECVREGRCGYYPCHQMDEELVCLFCYCPFYPCGDTVTGGKYIEGREGPVWDCTGCGWVHRKEVAARIVRVFYDGLDKDEIFKIIRREYFGDNE
ncbi:MAG: hypothetical protein A2Y33_11525 [Spirochaetes bacterium GWF1_51_8]|nr:MAG: hypothetical protein A2Y33_11525 [Spirochaetes bacterium GWF1_51_8]